MEHFGDDQFFSAPSTQPATRHVSVSPGPEKDGQSGEPAEASLLVKSINATDSSISPSPPLDKSPPPRESLSAEPVFQSLLAIKHRDSLQIGRFAQKAKARQRPSRMESVAETLDQDPEDQSDDGERSTAVQNHTGQAMESSSEQNDIEGLVGNIQAFHISTPPVPAEPAPTPPRTNNTASSAPICSPGLPDAISPPTSLVQMEIQAIVRKIQTFLAQRHHGNCLLPAHDTSRGVSCGGATGVQSHATTEGPSPDSFLVSTRDIAGILDIVIAGLRTLHDEHFSGGCLTVLLPTGGHAKPSTASGALIPHCSGLADPATTISSVRSAFIHSSADESSRRGTTLRNLRATIITRQSVTEVNWDTSSESPDSSDNEEDLDSESRQSCCTGRKVSSCDTTHQASTSSAVPSRPHSDIFGPGNQRENTFEAMQTLERRPSSTPTKLGSRKRLGEKRTKLPVSAPNEEDIVSFPALRSRTCTNDWIKPPRQIEDLQKETSPTTPTMYECGVDAHSCFPREPVASRTDEDVSPDGTNQRGDGHIAIGANSASTSQPPATVEPRDKKDKRMGAALGKSAGQRRSSSQMPKPPPLAPENALFNKLRHYSFTPLVEQIPETLREAPIPRLLKPVNDVAAERHRRKSGKEMLEDILAREQHPQREP